MGRRAIFFGNLLTRLILGSSLGTFQARWRGVSLRRRLAAALAAVTWPDLEEEEEELLEELDKDGFTFDEVCARTSSRVLCTLTSFTPHQHCCRD